MPSGNTVYQCNNPSCELGVPGEPGHFTEGVDEYSAKLRNFSEWGEDICPNCGVKGKATEDTLIPLEGDDPNQAVHDAVWESFRPDNDVGAVTTATTPMERLELIRKAQPVLLTAVELLDDPDNKISKVETAVANAHKEHDLEVAGTKP